MYSLSSWSCTSSKDKYLERSSTKAQKFGFKTMTVVWRSILMLQVNTVPCYSRAISLSSGNASTVLCRMCSSQSCLSLQCAEDELDLMYFQHCACSSLSTRRTNSAHLPWRSYSCKVTTYAGGNTGERSFGLHSRLNYVMWFKLSWLNNYVEEGVYIEFITSKYSHWQ